MKTLHVVRPIIKDIWGVPHYGPEDVLEDEARLGELVVALLDGEPSEPVAVQRTEWGHLMMLFRRGNRGVLVTEFRDWTKEQLEEFLRTREPRE